MIVCISGWASASCFPPLKAVTALQKPYAWSGRCCDDSVQSWCDTCWLCNAVQWYSHVDPLSWTFLNSVWKVICILRAQMATNASSSAAYIHGNVNTSLSSCRLGCTLKNPANTILQLAGRRTFLFCRNAISHSAEIVFPKAGLDTLTPGMLLHLRDYEWHQ